MRHLRKRLRIRSFKQAVRARYHSGAYCKRRPTLGGHYAILAAGHGVIETGRTRNEAWARAAGEWLRLSGRAP